MNVAAAPGRRVARVKITVLSSGLSLVTTTFVRVTLPELLTLPV